MKQKNELVITYHKKQAEIFRDSAKVKLIHKGRRFGLTRGLANYIVERAVKGNIKVLWVDTVLSNIDRYYDRYFYPLLSQLQKKTWSFNSVKKELKIMRSVIDFRSADRPENIEGFGYDLIIINEAGIVLKDEYLWYNSILPMSLDYSADMLIGGTPEIPD